MRMLRLEQVEVCYGETVILRDIDFQIDAGQVVSLIGRNGVGKTTLVKTIIGLLSPRKGKIFLDDRDVTETSPDERVRRGVAYVPQGREIFPRLTVEENLLLGLEGAREKKEIPERIFAMFPALKSMLHRQGGDLSGGQQQQLAIAGRLYPARV